jgi:uncharacterized protein YbjT (DUF2867 family)
MIIVTGATGNVGRPLVRALVAAGEQVTSISRTPAPLSPGVRPVSADLARAESLRPVLTGASALFLLPAGELLTSAGDPSALLDVIKGAGIGRVVLLSSQASATRPSAISHARLRDFEDAVTGSGLDWTILRPGGFASNSYAFAESIRARRTVLAPFGDIGLPVVDPLDIAEVAAAALRESGHSGRSYLLTGPAAVTPREQTAVLGRALGQELTFVELSREQARTHLLTVMPEPVVDGTLDILGAPLPEEQAVSATIGTVLGRPARPYASWAQRHIAAFR